MNNLARRLALSGDFKWVALVAGGAMGVLTAFYAQVFIQLSAVRPLLVFLLVNGAPPPICGFCVLFDG